MSDPSPLEPDVMASDDVERLRAEIARLRSLLGPSEEAYEKLRLDVLGARDAAIAAETELGRTRAMVGQLQTDVARYRRDFVLMRRILIRPLKRVVALSRQARHLIGSVARIAVRR